MASRANPPKRPRPSRTVLLFVGVVWVAGGSTLAWLVARDGTAWILQRPTELAVLLVATVIADLKPIVVPHGSETEHVSVSTTFAYALVLGWGALAGILGLALGAIVGGVSVRRPAWKVGFNVAQFTLAIAAAAAVLGVGHHGPLGELHPFHATDLPLVMLGGGVFFILNNTTIATAIGLSQGRGILAVNREGFLWQFAMATGLISLSPVIAVLMEWNPWILPLLFFPLVGTHIGARASEDRLRNEDRYRAMAQNATDLVVIVDDSATVTYVSPSVEQGLGFRPEELIGRSVFSTLVVAEDADRIGMLFSELLAAPGNVITAEVRARHAGGGLRSLEVVCKNLLHDRNVAGIVVNGRDVTERKVLEQELSHQAFHDPLTGLANRALIKDRIDHALVRSSRVGERTSVMFLDIDDFKNVNDSLGHVAGDGVLIEVAKRLRGSLRPDDTAARFGGDEFVLLLEDTDSASASAVAERVLRSLSPPVMIQRHEVIIRASVGIATAGSDGSAELLLRDADVAMYAAKGRGKGTIQVYEPSMRDASVERLELDADLVRAVERGELFIHYQPVASLVNGELTGVEALVRWTHPRRGVLAPAAFIPRAEETGSIVAVGRFVLAEACRQAVEWKRDLRPLGVAVNVSARQLEETEFVQDVRRVLTETGLEPNLLTLEITESALMRNAEDSIARLQELKRLGVRIAVDDFGIGYSSLSYLKRFPVDVLKIDRLFVDGLLHGAEDSALARAIIQVGRSLNLVTVAEGIEDAEQLKRLGALGCEQGQGYFISRPVPAYAVTQLVRDTDRSHRQPGAGRQPSGAAIGVVPQSDRSRSAQTAVSR